MANTMTPLPHILSAWNGADFEEIFKTAIANECINELPLQQNLKAGSYALDEAVQVMLISSEETVDNIKIKTGIFYKSILSGCACPGDPTVEEEQNEYCEILVTINKKTALAEFRPLESLMYVSGSL